MEDLKKKFIVEENLEEKKLVGYVERILPFCKISKSGGIILEMHEATALEKVKLALVARFLANHLEGSISPEVNPEELSRNLDIPKDQVYARLKELKDDRFAVTSDKGIYRVNTFEIGKFLDEIEGKYGSSKK